MSTPTRQLNPEEILYALFAQLHYVWLPEYGSSYAVRATARDFVFRVRGRKPKTPDAPSYLLTVRPTGNGFQVRYRPTGKDAPDAEELSVGYGEEEVLSQLSGIVLGYVEVERKRVKRYWKSRKA